MPCPLSPCEALGLFLSFYRIVIVYRILETIVEIPKSLRFDFFFFIERYIESFDTISNTMPGIRYNSLSFSSLFLYPGADYTVCPSHFHFISFMETPTCLCCVLFSIFRFFMCACCASSVFLACCVFCVLAVCAVRSGHWVRAVCVCFALCVMRVGSAVHHSATQSRIICSSFSSHRNPLNGCVYDTPKLNMIFVKPGSKPRRTRYPPI